MLVVRLSKCLAPTPLQCDVSSLNGSESPELSILVEEVGDDFVSDSETERILLLFPE